MLEIITSDALPGTRHGFFTRKGGASSGIFAGLNCGTGSSDLSDAVAINRTRVAQAMDLPLSHLVTMQFSHSLCQQLSVRLFSDVTVACAEQFFSIVVAASGLRLPELPVRLQAVWPD